MTPEQEIAIGMARAKSGAGSAWRCRAETVILDLLCKNEFFHVNNLWEVLETPENGPRAVGQIIKDFAKAGLIQKVEKIPSNKARQLPMWKWRSLLYNKEN